MSALVPALRHDLNVLPIFDHRSLLLKKDHLSKNRQMVHILNMKNKTGSEMTFVAFFQQHSRWPPFFQLMTLYGECHILSIRILQSLRRKRRFLFPAYPQGAGKGGHSLT